MYIYSYVIFIVTFCFVIHQEKDRDLQRKDADLHTLLKRLWKVAAPYWSSQDKFQARSRLAAVFALTLATTGISVGFNFLGRDFYNALASISLYIFYIIPVLLFYFTCNYCAHSFTMLFFFFPSFIDKDQEQFTKQLLYYLGGFAGGIPVSTNCSTFPLGIPLFLLSMIQSFSNHRQPHRNLVPFIQTPSTRTHKVLNLAHTQLMMSQYSIVSTCKLQLLTCSNYS